MKLKEFFSRLIEAVKSFIKVFKTTKVEAPAVVVEPVAPPVAPVIPPVQPTPPPVAPTVEKPTEKPKEEPKEVKDNIPDHPQPKTPVVKLDCGCYIKGKDGSGGFVNNPDNSRKTLKIVCPSQYTNKIVEVVVWTEDGSFLERLYNKQPGEWGNRERYYGKKNIKDYPKNLTVGLKLVDGTVVCVKVPDPQTRQD